jgi:hypothetical protein
MMGHDGDDWAALPSLALPTAGHESQALHLWMENDGRNQLGSSHHYESWG